MQRFIATDPFTFPDGSIGWRPGGAFDCLGPFAKVQNCRVEGYDQRYTCYATGYADSFFSVPAHTRIKGKRVVGFFTMENESPVFVPNRNQPK